MKRALGKKNHYNSVEMQVLRGCPCITYCQYSGFLMDKGMTWLTSAN